MQGYTPEICKVINEAIAQDLKKLGSSHGKTVKRHTDRQSTHPALSAPVFVTISFDCDPRSNCGSDAQAPSAPALCCVAVHPSMAAPLRVDIEPDEAEPMEVDEEHTGAVPTPALPSESGTPLVTEPPMVPEAADVPMEEAAPTPGAQEGPALGVPT